MAGFIGSSDVTASVGCMGRICQYDTQTLHIEQFTVLFNVMAFLISKNMHACCSIARRCVDGMFPSLHQLLQSVCIFVVPLVYAFAAALTMCMAFVSQPIIHTGHRVFDGT